MSTTPQRFAFSYGKLRMLMTILGLGPGLSRIEVRSADVVVRMGWAFRARIERSAITSAHEDQMLGLGIGVHGWRGQWLVNGSTEGIVTLDIDPPGRGLALGFPVKVRRLQVSVEDPGRFLAALGMR
jgi:hypothetical protein